MVCLHPLLVKPDGYRMKEKIDWKYVVSCIVGGAIVIGSYFIYDIAPVSSICFIIVGVMIPTGYALFNRR